MECEGDEGNEPVPAWSFNPVSTRLKPRSASHNQSRNWVHTAIDRILYVYSISISRWSNISLYEVHIAWFSHLWRCFLTWVSRQQGEVQSQCPENGTCKYSKDWRGNNCWTLGHIQEAMRNECLVGLYQPWDRSFRRVSCMTTTFRRSTWSFIGSNRFLPLEPCISILPRDMNKHINQTSRTVGKPPITISNTGHM
jgi:hypothetical protein